MKPLSAFWLFCAAVALSISAAQFAPGQSLPPPTTIRAEAQASIAKLLALQSAPTQVVRCVLNGGESLPWQTTCDKLLAKYDASHAEVLP